MTNEFTLRPGEGCRSASARPPARYLLRIPQRQMLLKCVDVLGFELVLRHKKSATSPTERHKRSYRFRDPFRCPTFTYVQLSR